MDNNLFYLYKYLLSFSPSDPETAGFNRRLSANFRSDSDALAGRFHDRCPVEFISKNGVFKFYGSSKSTNGCEFTFTIPW